MVSKYILIPKADLQWKFESAIPQPLTLLLDKYVSSFFTF